MIPEEAVVVLRELNPWWGREAVVRPRPPEYRRPAIRALSARLARPGGIIEVIRGPRQVGKTTGILQVIEDLIAQGMPPDLILFVRFDLEVIRELPQALLSIFRWHQDRVQRNRLGTRAPPVLFLDEIHKLRRWDEQVKHLADTFPVKLVATGSSSVLVARGGRESLAGRVFTTELPTFSFREVLEAWEPDVAGILPPRLRFTDAFEVAARSTFQRIDGLRPQQKLSLRRHLDRYFNRGGYPRLHSGEVDDDRWADYLVQTVFDNVLGADIPDLFPVQEPRLLRNIYLSVARHSGRELSQLTLVDEANAAGFQTTQPTVGRYLHYLADALLIREFRRYPLSKKRTARVPAKITLSDLGVRNAIFRGAPSLWESDPAVLGPLVETVVQTVMHDLNLQVHFFKDYETPGKRSTRPIEVDFVAERIDGRTLPVEVKFRKRIEAGDTIGTRAFLERYDAAWGIVVTRETMQWDAGARLLFVPLLSFLLAF